MQKDDDGDVVSDIFFELLGPLKKFSKTKDERGDIDLQFGDIGAILLEKKCQLECAFSHLI
jgi:hypothetical protein